MSKKIVKKRSSSNDQGGGVPNNPFCERRSLRVLSYKLMYRLFFAPVSKVQRRQIKAALFIHMKSKKKFDAEILG
jgi:hypothetical protein